MSTVNEFCILVTEQLQERGWSDSLLAQRAGMTPSAISRVLSGERGVTCNWTIAVAQALDMDPVHALRLADILPDVPPSIAEEQEALTILRSLPPVQRSSALLMLRGLGLSGAGPAPTDQRPDARHEAPPQRETVQLDHTTLRVVEYIYRSYGEEPPEGCDIPVTADLVRLLLRQIVEFYNVMRPFLQAETRHSPEKRERARQLSDEERQGEPCRD